DLFNVLNSPDENVVLKTFRDLHFHATLMNLMGLDLDSIAVLHGGGIYENKAQSMIRWVQNFNKLPNYIKERVVLENDETSFSVEDCLSMSKSVDVFSITDFGSDFRKKQKEIKSKVPIVFDLFHYYCYNLFLAKHNYLLGVRLHVQKSIETLLPLVKETWDQSHRTMKMHVSEQLLNGTFGAHADFVDVIPEELLNFAADKTIYLMIEAKAKELSLFHLRKKYPKITI